LHLYSYRRLIEIHHKFKGEKQMKTANAEKIVAVRAAGRQVAALSNLAIGSDLPVTGQLLGLCSMRP
jgi:hypothetical protein